MIIQSPKHLLSLLGIRRETYLDFTDNPQNYYNEWKIEKTDAADRPILGKDGKPKFRVIHPPKPRLKAVQKQIKRLVFDEISLPMFVQGGVRKRDNVTNAALHKGNHYFFQTDVKSFFPTITNSQVYAMFIEIGQNTSVASYLTKLTTYKGRVPQGSPTSTAIANLTFSSIDKLIAEMCTREELTYTRFVDDIVISGKHDFRDLSSEIVKAVISEGFRISRRKTFFKKGVVNVTGVELHQNYLTTTKEFSESLMQQLSSPRLAGKLNYHMRVHDIGSKPRSLIYKGYK